MAPQELSEAQLKLLTKALEAIFAKKNIATDEYVNANINAGMYMSIRAAARHPSLIAHELGGTGEAVPGEWILQAAQKSSKLSADERMGIRPLIKLKRVTIILREMPADCTVEELTQLFDAAPAKPVSIAPDVLNTWFAKFSSDKDTQATALWLRSQKLRGTPIKSAIKNEHFLRSTVPLEEAAKGIVPGSAPTTQADATAYEMPAEPTPAQPSFIDTLPPGLGTPGHWEPWGAQRPDWTPKGEGEVINLRPAGWGKGKGKWWANGASQSNTEQAWDKGGWDQSSPSGAQWPRRQRGSRGGRSHNKKKVDANGAPPAESEFPTLGEKSDGKKDKATWPAKGADGQNAKESKPDSAKASEGAKKDAKPSKVEKPVKSDNAEKPEKGAKEANETGDKTEKSKGKGRRRPAAEARPAP